MSNSDIFKLAVLVTASAMTIGCSRTEPIVNIVDNPVVSTSDVTFEEVEGAIIQAGRNRGWIMQVIEPGHIVGVLEVRQHRAEVDIYYSAAAYTIQYKDSSVLSYDGEEIHRNYNKWINNLDLDIRQEMPV